MAINICRGPSDEELSQVVVALDVYVASHPAATVDLYRQGRFSIRVRIVDPGFADLTPPERHDLTWPVLERLPDGVLNDLSTVLLLAPDELPDSFANAEFEHPVEQVLL